MIDEFMFKLAQIRSSYTRKIFGTINNEEKPLIDYETFCLELIKEIENLQQENQRLKEQKKELRSWLEEQIEQFQYAEGDYGEWDTNIDDLEMVLSKLNELEEGKNE